MLKVVVQGDGGEAMAALTVPEMRKQVGPVEIVRCTSDPWGQKLRLGIECRQPFILADVDLLFRKPWDPTACLMKAADGALCAAEVTYKQRTPKRFRHIKVWNSGLMAVGPAHRAVFRRAWEIREEIGHATFFAEEGPLSIAIAEAGARVSPLSPLLNVQVGAGGKPSNEDIARHFVGGTVWGMRLAAVRSELNELAAAPRPSPHRSA